jgi:hypothetical protein
MSPSKKLDGARALAQSQRVLPLRVACTLVAGDTPLPLKSSIPALISSSLLSISRDHKAGYPSSALFIAASLAARPACSQHHRTRAIHILSARRAPPHPFPLFHACALVVLIRKGRFACTSFLSFKSASRYQSEALHTSVEGALRADAVYRVQTERVPVSAGVDTAPRCCVFAPISRPR